MMSNYFVSLSITIADKSSYLMLFNYLPQKIIFRLPKWFYYPGQSNNAVKLNDDILTSRTLLGVSMNANVRWLINTSYLSICPVIKI